MSAEYFKDYLKTEEETLSSLESIIFEPEAQTTTFALYTTLLQSDTFLHHF